MKRKLASLEARFAQAELSTLGLILVVCGIFGPSIFVPVHGTGSTEPNDGTGDEIGAGLDEMMDDETPPDEGDEAGAEAESSTDSKAADGELGVIRQEPIEEKVVEVATESALPKRRNLAEYVDLQETVERWAGSTAGQVAVEVYDLDYHRVAASYRANTVMSPKSLYKLFYAYDGYARISSGAEDPDQPYLGQTTLGHCLDAMIRNSDNPCAEAMLDDTARAGRVGELVRNFGLSQTQANGLSTSALDVSLLLQRYYTHAGWSSAAWSSFLNSALRQPAYLRKGLPSGFQAATVYNKAGFGPNAGGYMYNDAAIVEFSGGRHYIVVVMTAGAAQTSLAKLGAELEQAVMYGE